MCTIGTLNLDLAIKIILKNLFGILKMPHLLFNYKNNNEIKIYFFNFIIFFKWSFFSCFYLYKVISMVYLLLRRFWVNLVYPSFFLVFFLVLLFNIGFFILWTDSCWFFLFFCYYFSIILFIVVTFFLFILFKGLMSCVLDFFSNFLLHWKKFKQLRQAQATNIR